MNRVLSIIGIIVTIVYIGLVTCLRWDDILGLGNLSLNELGDFLGGVFGPLAIFWLIFGFLQQGQELKQNTKALKLQADELRNSVEQQERLAKASEEQLKLLIDESKEEKKRLRKSQQPDFKLVKAGKEIGDRFDSKFKAVIKNIGATASDLVFSIKENVQSQYQDPPKCSPSIRNQDHTIHWTVETNNIPREIRIDIKCFDAADCQYSDLLELYTTDDSTYRVKQSDETFDS